MSGLKNIAQDDYQLARRETATFLKTALKESLDAGQLTKVNDYAAKPTISFAEYGLASCVTKSRWELDFLQRNEKAKAQTLEREALAKSIIKADWYKSDNKKKRMDALVKAGVYTSLGQNFYDLRGPVALLYPVNTPFRNSIPRIGRVNDGVGTAAHWMATTNPGYVYAGVSEGNRNAIGTPNNNQYMAAYKELGSERNVSFTAQYAAEGFADELADQHIQGLQVLFLQQEAMMMMGNSGATGTGYKLGTAPTPTGATPITTRTVGAAGNLGPGNWDLPYGTALTTSNYVSVACVVLTAMGNPANVQFGYLPGGAPTITSGLTPQYTRVNADGSRDVLNGGISAVSAISNVEQITSGSALTVQFSIPAASLPIKGAYGYAWFVDVETSNTGTLANAKFAGITYNPYCYVSGTPLGTQTANYTSSQNGNLQTDNSYQNLDYDGLLTYSASTAGATYTDLLGASLTSQKNGRITQFETILENIYTQYQAGVDRIWCSPDAIEAVDQAIRYSGSSGNSPGMQFIYRRDEQNNLLGGFVVAAYQSRFATNNPMGANAIPIVIHPMMPLGTIYFEVSTNPYPQSRIPFTRGMLVQREYYAIEWPVVTRQWGNGTYVHEVLAEYVPWIGGVLTGVGGFVGS